MGLVARGPVAALVVRVRHPVGNIARVLERNSTSSAEPPEECVFAGQFLKDFMIGVRCSHALQFALTAIPAALYAPGIYQVWRSIGD